MVHLLAKGRELYASLTSGDADALSRLLSPDFEGQLTAGLLHGFGRAYHDLDAMMREGWAAVGEWFEMAPHAEELFDGGTVLIGRGYYVGKARSTGKPLRAAFAHFWTYDGERFTGVHQVTDSGAWRDALQD